MRRTAVFTSALILAAMIVYPAVSPATPPSIAPIQSHPHGRAYSAWAAAWWQWALETPASVNPVLDLTGARCAEGQTGRVWFLAGSFGSDPVERTCSVPTGTALLIPLINAFSGATPGDPPETRTEEFQRAQVACTYSGLSAEINGVAVNDPFQYFEQSRVFDVQLPADSIFGIGEVVVSPTVDAGFYLFLQPLPPGEYTIHWAAAMSCPFGSSSQDVTYHLTVR